MSLCEIEINNISGVFQYGNNPDKHNVIWRVSGLGGDAQEGLALHIVGRHRCSHLKAQPPDEPLHIAVIVWTISTQAGDLVQTVCCT